MLALFFCISTKHIVKSSSEAPLSHRMMWGFLLIIHEILLMLTEYDSQVSNVELLASEMWGRLEIHPAVRYDFFVNNEFWLFYGPLDLGYGPLARLRTVDLIKTKLVA